MGGFHNIVTGATRVPANDIIEVDMSPDASTLPLGQKLEGVQAKSYKYNLWGIYDVKHSDDGSYRFTPKKPVGGKRNKTRKVRRNRKRNTRRR